jgi:hypothetical protein
VNGVFVLFQTISKLKVEDASKAQTNNTKSEYPLYLHIGGDNSKAIYRLQLEWRMQLVHATALVGIKY